MFIYDDRHLPRVFFSLRAYEEKDRETGRGNRITDELPTEEPLSTPLPLSLVTSVDPARGPSINPRTKLITSTYQMAIKRFARAFPGGMLHNRHSSTVFSSRPVRKSHARRQLDEMKLRWSRWVLRPFGEDPDDLSSLFGNRRELRNIFRRFYKPRVA